jgi:hypothetical protein
MSFARTSPQTTLTTPLETSATPVRSNRAGGARSTPSRATISPKDLLIRRARTAIVSWLSEDPPECRRVLAS